MHGGENGPNGCHLAGISEDGALPATSWLPTNPPLSHPVGVLLVLATPVKNLSKMAGNLASYSPNSW